MPLKPINTKERFEEVKKHPGLAYLYAKDTLKRRWPEVEPLIMAEPSFAALYARDVIKNRWVEAEPIIMKDYAWAYQYTKDVLKRRWPEAEPFIKENDWYWNLYKSYLRKIKE